jgi:molecular chaperone DnaJ
MLQDPEAAKKFQEVQRAYDTLRDAQKRAAYDRMGHERYEASEAGTGEGPFGAGGQQVDPEELLREFFGRGGGGGAEVGWHLAGILNVAAGPALLGQRVCDL